MDKKNSSIIISAIKNNLSKISKLLEGIIELNYSHRHEEFNKHIINAFAEIKLAMVCIDNNIYRLLFRNFLLLSFCRSSFPNYFF